MKRITILLMAVTSMVAVGVTAITANEVVNDTAPAAEAVAGGCSYSTGYHTDWIPPFDSYGTFKARCTTGDSNDRWYALFRCRLSPSSFVDATPGAFAVGTTWRSGRCPTNHTASFLQFVKYDA